MGHKQRNTAVNSHGRTGSASSTTSSSVSSQQHNMMMTMPCTTIPTAIQQNRPMPPVIDNVSSSKIHPILHPSSSDFGFLEDKTRVDGGAKATPHSQPQHYRQATGTLDLDDDDCELTAECIETLLTSLKDVLPQTASQPSISQQQQQHQQQQHHAGVGQYHDILTGPPKHVQQHLFKSNQGTTLNGSDFDSLLEPRPIEEMMRQKHR
jgi:hypothetical protein